MNFVPFALVDGKTYTISDEDLPDGLKITGANDLTVADIDAGREVVFYEDQVERVSRKVIKKSDGENTTTIEEIHKYKKIVTSSTSNAESSNGVQNRNKKKDGSAASDSVDKVAQDAIDRSSCSRWWSCCRRACKKLH